MITVWLDVKLFVRNSGLVTCFSKDMIVMVPYSWLLYEICTAYIDWGSFCFINIVCSWYLWFVQHRIICVWHLWVRNSHISYVRVYYCFLRSYMVLVLLNAILTFVFFKKFVILLNMLWYINVIQVFIFFIVSYPCSTCNWEFSFWIRAFGKLLALVMCCIMVHSFCFRSSVRGSKCIRIM
jgi:hypothetical protein